MKLKPRDMVLVALFAALTAIGAFLKVPIGPAPISLQNFFSMTAGALLGARLGALSQAIYVAMGLLGVPVFTSGGGPSYVLNPTFGFLLGFVLCAWVIGRMTEGKKPEMKRFLAASVVGSALVYLLGVPWLYLVLTKISGVEMTLLKAIKVGCLVFLPGDALKVFAVSWLASQIVPRLTER